MLPLPTIFGIFISNPILKQKRHKIHVKRKGSYTHKEAHAQHGNASPSIHYFALTLITLQVYASFILK